MKCPADGETLVITERSGVEIDYCPKCRGVWLDRGELDKIIDRAATVLPAPVAAPRSDGPRENYARDRGDRFGGDDDDDDDDNRRGRGGRRGGFLGDIFDF